MKQNEASNKTHTRNMVGSIALSKGMYLAMQKRKEGKAGISEQVLGQSGKKIETIKKKVSKKKISSLSSKSKKIKKTIAKFRKPFSEKNILTVNNNIQNQVNPNTSHVITRKLPFKKDENTQPRSMRSAPNPGLNKEMNKKFQNNTRFSDVTRGNPGSKNSRFLEDFQKKNLGSSHKNDKENKGRLVFCDKTSFYNSTRTQVLKFRCFRDEDLNFGQYFSSKIIPHKFDNDCQTDEEQMKLAVKFLYKSLYYSTIDESKRLNN